MKKTRSVAMLLCLVTILTLFMSIPAFADENGVDKVTLGKVTANALNLRQEKSTSSKVLTVIPEGTKIAIAEKDGDGWSKVMIGGYVGYVSSKYITTLEDGDANLSYGKLVGEVVYVREGPGTSYPIEAALVEGSYMKITGIEKGWFKVETLGGKYEGYMHPNYILPVKRTEVEGEPEPEPKKTSSSSSSSKKTSSSNKQSSSGATKADKLISIAKQYLGVPYVWGGASPKGFDCGGFTKYCYNKIGTKLPHTGQYNYGTKVKYSNLKKGDLVFFSSSGSRSISHVGIYISGGKFIHASSPGDDVKIDTLASGYYYSHFVTARRILK
ncbi:MAG: NlpC/P60 family protein [Ruminococcaceae bacterium]|nr:NlpC/P60 family protein [Oscillospiraceae bacterium]